MKRISLEELTRPHRHLPYEQQYAHIRKLLESGRIRPVKASGRNGKKPALYMEYWLTEEEKTDVAELTEELKFRLVPRISTEYYLRHLDAYRKERLWVLMLNEYFKERGDLLSRQESVNERSFEIWGREKFLAKEQGKRVLAHCGLEMDGLNIYETAEPLACYSHTREVPQNLLILENKDTFYTMRRHLLEGGSRILGVAVGTLIYGGGKRILRSFQDFQLCIEPYMRAEGNHIYYFGDLDYEGIGIYENLAEAFQGKWEILPFIPTYEAMLKKGRRASLLPETKEQQNRNLKGTFWEYFPADRVEEMKGILEKGRYIPQEILNSSDDLNNPPE